MTTSGRTNIADVRCIIRNRCCTPCCNIAATWCIPLQHGLLVTPSLTYATLYTLDDRLRYAHTARRHSAIPATHCTRTPTWCSTGVFSCSAHCTSARTRVDRARALFLRTFGNTGTAHAQRSRRLRLARAAYFPALLPHTQPQQCIHHTPMEPRVELPGHS